MINVNVLYIIILTLIIPVPSFPHPALPIVNLTLTHPYNHSPNTPIHLTSYTPSLNLIVPTLISHSLLMLILILAAEGA